MSTLSKVGQHCRIGVRYHASSCQGALPFYKDPMAFCYGSAVHLHIIHLLPAQLLRPAGEALWQAGSAGAGPSAPGRGP